MKVITEIFNRKIKDVIASKVKQEEIVEIRMRIHCPLIINLLNHELVFHDCIVDAADIKDTFNIITGYSAYAYENNIKEGYLSIEGGHRVGFGGQAVIQEGKVSVLKNITFLNIRVCHTVEGCGRKFVNRVLAKKSFENTLIISPPGMGKTTLLRDIVKNLSDNIEGTSICVIDERNEISGSFQGKPSISLGIRTDVITDCSKECGIIMAIRALAPKIIAVDEIGCDEDIKALQYASVSGVKIIATIHGENIQDAKNKLGDAFEQIFTDIIVINKRGDYICY